MRNQINKIEKKYDTTDEMLTDLGLDFEVGLRQSFIAGTAMVDGIPVQGKANPNQFAICQIDGDVATPLGDKTGATVTDGYQVIQQREAFSMIDGLIEQGAKLSRYGILDGGKHSFIELDLGDTDIATDDDDGVGRKTDYGFGGGTNSKGQSVGDIVKRLITINVYHDGSHSVNARMHNKRLICLNGMTTSKSSSMIKIRHSKQYQEALIDAKGILGIADTYYKWFEGKCRDLYRRPVSLPVAKALVEKLYPSKVHTDGKKHKDPQNTWRNDIMERFVNGIGTKGETYWDLYNGITEHWDHKETKRDEFTQYRSSADGSDDQKKVDAFELLVASHDLSIESEAYAINAALTA